MRIDPAAQAARAEAARAERLKTGATGFAEALRQAEAAPALEFSKHALQRLEQRGIRLDDELLRRLDEGVAKAAGKGSKTTLVLADQTAFVVGVPSRTVVTVADQESLRERVFTNIDSMVIV